MRVCDVLHVAVLVDVAMFVPVTVVDLGCLLVVVAGPGLVATAVGSMARIKQASAVAR